ncbi:hypothetical protein HYS31_02715 [Candidatus Woesearchaeota archaeon]|nr:hypothetical protein [Candidatus Woesearchaeota archaeon]
MDSKEDDDISIDFGKIKNFFRGSKEESKAESNASIGKEAESSDELSIDFSRLKNFFKPSGKEHGDEHDIPINWSAISDFLRKYGVVLLALIPIILSIYVRMQAGSLGFADDWASNSVINGIRSQIRSAIDQQYPNLPDANKDALVSTELQKVTSQNKQQIDSQITATSAYFKSFYQDEGGKNYMPDIDPYYWFRYAKNIVENGHPGDILKDGRSYDTHQLAPIGRFVFPDMFHAYSLAYFYKFVHLFSPGITLMRSIFYLPVLVSALCIMLVFLIARRIAGNLSGFFAGLIMAVNGAFLGRTLFGHADNDIWVVFFPLIVTWLFLLAFDVRSILKAAALSLAAGFFTGVFSFTWSGWWYIFDFIIATIAITFLYMVLISFNEIRRDYLHVLSVPALKNILIIGIVYFASSLLFVSMFLGWNSFKESFIGPFSFPSIKAPITTSVWPNVLTTVAELNEGSIGGIINSVGGSFLFYISLLGIVLSVSRKEGIRRFELAYLIVSILFYTSYFILIKIGIEISLYGLLAWIMLPIIVWILIAIYKKDSSYDFRLPILLSLWVASTIFASIKGIRFTLLLAPAFSVAFGVALGRAYGYLSRTLNRELKIHKIIGGGILIILLLLMYISPTKAALNAAKYDVPLINDVWYNALAAIKQDSKEDAIITSWWDFGHHFKALADRRVTFDGTTQTFAPAHWVGKILMLDDEAKAMGILRMLDCGSGEGFNELYKLIKDNHLSIGIINEIVSLDRSGAEDLLKGYGLSPSQAESVLKYTHCNPPEAYFIASEDMIGKSGVWAHFGSWDFKRADIWYNRNLPEQKQIEKIMNEYNYSKDTAENIYSEVQDILNEPDPNERNRRANSWIAPWPAYGGVVSCSRNDAKLFQCSNGFQINMSNYDVFGVGPEGIVRPRIVAFATEDGVLKKQFEGNTADLGLTILPNSKSEVSAVLTNKELAGSMFTRMFYMNGHGLRFFKPFNHQRGLTGTDIYTYKVDWDGRNTTIVDEYAGFFVKSEEKMESANIASSEPANLPEANKTSLANNS